MHDVRERQQIRQFIGAWMRTRDCATLDEVQAVAQWKRAASPSAP